MWIVVDSALMLVFGYGGLCSADDKGLPLNQSRFDYLFFSLPLVQIQNMSTKDSGVSSKELKAQVYNSNGC